jgi:hypothetical protein
MLNQHTDDPLEEIVAATELSLALLGILYYYTVQLPEQRQKLKARSSFGHDKRVR